jgi:hypothetical protein
VPIVAKERTGVIVVRAWIENDASATLRARITTSSDLSSEEQTVTVAAGIDEVVAGVRDWLEAFMGA